MGKTPDSDGDGDGDPVLTQRFQKMEQVLTQDGGRCLFGQDDVGGALSDRTLGCLEQAAGELISRVANSGM